MKKKTKVNDGKGGKPGKVTASPMSDKPGILEQLDTMKVLQSEDKETRMKAVEALQMPADHEILKSLVKMPFTALDVRLKAAEKLGKQEIGKRFQEQSLKDNCFCYIMYLKI